MEIGYDDDVDAEIRSQVEGLTGEELVDEDSDEIVDAVLLWYRADDGDLADLLVDVQRAVLGHRADAQLGPPGSRELADHQYFQWCAERAKSTTPEIRKRSLDCTSSVRWPRRRLRRDPPSAILPTG